MVRRTGVIVLLIVALLLMLLGSTEVQAGGPCGLTSPAFCETFDAPVGGAERSGDLNSTVWGVSRVTQLDNISQGYAQAWANATLNLCGTNTPVHAGTDWRVCGGQLAEALNDNGETAAAAAYPRQPFDFAGRTGTVNFDVSDNTQGTHAAWPAMVITDQPVPMPEGLLDNQPGIINSPRNGIGVSFANQCGGSTQVGVDRIWTVTNYVTADAPLSQDGCVGISGSINSLNHVSVQVSSTHVTVYMSDAGGSNSVKVADAPISAPLTRGLVWIEDVHYNADKVCETAQPPLPSSDCQANNTFAWDNVGFDGPVLTRDLGVEVPDNTTNDGVPPYTNGSSTQGIGYVVPQTGNGVLSLPVNGVSNIAGAQAVLLEFTAFPWAAGDTYTYAFNGHAAHTARPDTTTSFDETTVALSVPVTDLQDGKNTLTISDNNEAIDIANIDVIEAGAGGASAPTPTPGATTTPTATPTPAPTATPTATPAPGAKTLGLTTVGSTADDGDAQNINGSRFTIGSVGGTATSVSVYVGAVGTSPNNQFQMAIYANNGGAPGALVASTASGTLVANSWNTLPISATLNANTAYWLMYNANGSSGSVNNMTYNNGGSGMYRAETFGTWPSTMGSVSTGGWTFAIYATYN